MTKTPSDASMEISRRDISHATMLLVCATPLFRMQSAPKFIPGVVPLSVIRYIYIHIYTEVFFFLFSAHLLPSPFFCPSGLVVTQIGGDVAGSSPPSPTTVRALHLVARRLERFLPSSTRVEFATYAKQPSRSTNFFLLQIQAISHDGGIRTRTPGPTLAAFQGGHY